MIVVLLLSSFVLVALLCFFYNVKKQNLKACINCLKRLPCCRACGCAYRKLSRNARDASESRQRATTGTFDSSSSGMSSSDDDADSDAENEAGETKNPSSTVDVPANSRVELNSSPTRETPSSSTTNSERVEQSEV